MAKSKNKSFRKRDLILYGGIIIAALVLVVGVAAAVEHLPGKTAHPTETAPVITEPPAVSEDVAETLPPEVTAPEATVSEPETTPVPENTSAPEISEDTTSAATQATKAETEDLKMPEDTGKPADAKTVEELEAELADDYTATGYNNNIKNIVLIGIDRQELSENDLYRTGGQSDVILIVSMNLKTKEYFIVSINRDVAVPVENYSSIGGSYGVVEEQIALAYAYGDGGRSSGKNVLKSLNWLLGDDIKFLGYIAAPIPIVSTMADAVDGVDVLIEDDFTGVDSTLVMGQVVTLRGDHAEKFVRSRMTMKVSNKNSMRMDRQITFMTAWMQKAKSTMTANQLVDLYGDTLGMIKTNMGKSDITKWILTAYDYEFTGFYRIDGEEGERKHNARCLYYDPDEVKELVKSLYYQ